MERLLGRTLLSRYRVDALIGRGGMAQVYRAWDTRRSVHVAVKVLNEDLADDYVFLRRFAREARALELLQHPHIVRFFGFEESPGLAFLVLEYIDGSSLRHQLRLLGRPLTPSEALAVLQPVCGALHYAHQVGVLHCDVKPANILIERGGRVVLSDFGITRLTESATMTFSTPGTPAYMSPEQCQGEDLDARTDIYSLGIATYEMLTLDRPFKGNTESTTGSRAERVHWEQIHASPPPPRSVNPGIPSQAEVAILRALQKETERRQQGALEFYRDLSETGAVQPASSVPWVVEPEAPPVVKPESEPSLAMAPPARRQWLGLVVTLTAVLLLCVVVGGLILRSGWKGVARLEEPMLSPTTWSTATLAPSPTASSTAPAPTPTHPARPEETTIYIVQSGDTLLGIALEFGTTLEAIVAVNGLSSADAIHVGDQLIIPLGEAVPTFSRTATVPTPTHTFRPEETIIYTVQTGDTLAGIAFQYGTTVEAIVAANGLTSDSMLVGQMLVIPLGETIPTPGRTSTRTPTPTVSCPDVSGPFASTWSTVEDRIGCATDPQFTTWVAEETFQNGWMYWWEDDNRVHVVYDWGRWEAYPSIWQGGEPEFSCPDADTPAQSPPTPKRGFGKIWCTYPDVRQNLGWATEVEHGLDATVQHFEHGLMLRTNRWTWIFYDDGLWERR